MLNRRHLFGMAGALALTTVVPRGGLAKQGSLTAGSTFFYDVPPVPGSYDIQGEPLYGNSEFLMRPTMTGPKPWLAESVEQVESTRWRITLRPQITFQNGGPLDANALLANFVFYQSEANLGDPGLDLLGKPVSVEVSGDLSVDLVTAEPFPRLREGLAHYAYPIFDTVAASAAGDDPSALLTAGIFTGPFAWASLDPGTLTYRRYDGYWGGKPILESVIVNRVPDEQAGVQAISTGELDVLPYISSSVVPVAMGLPNVNIVVGPAVTFVGMAIQPRIAPFDDVAVRRALSLAVDNEAIAAALGNGISKPMKGWFPSDHPLALDWVVYDPAQAEAALEGAGWLRTGDGPRQKGGTELEARFYCYTDSGEAISTAVAEMANAVGFRASIVRFESYSEIQPVQNVDGGVYTVGTENIGLNGDPFGTMRQVVDVDYSTPGYPDWIEILDAVKSSSDPAVINGAIIAGQQLNADQVYWLPVLETGTPFAVSDAYKALEPNPFFFFVDASTAPSA